MLAYLNVRKRIEANMRIQQSYLNHVHTVLSSNNLWIINNVGLIFFCFMFIS